jgi:hypothetical protein
VSLKGNVATAPRDIPYGTRPIAVLWHKRRWRCQEPLCAKASFTESITELPCGALQRLEGASFVEVDHGGELVGNPRGRAALPLGQRSVDDADGPFQPRRTEHVGGTRRRGEGEQEGLSPVS